MHIKTGLHIKASVTLLFLLFLFIPETIAQFTNSGTSLNITYNSAVNWVDIDLDGDLDLSISGDKKVSSTGQGFLYLNISNVITFNKNIQVIEDGDQTWCDFDHNGRPDLLFAGSINGPSNPVPKAGIDIFDASLNYVTKSSDFTPVSFASVDWGDYDNDGDNDILISGKDASGTTITKLYTNNKTSFSEVNAGLPGIINGKAEFIDYDLDKDLDIFISGRDINENKYTRLWKNTAGVYTVTGDLFVNLEHSQFGWGDFNGDGYPDLILGGYNNTSGTRYIYLNNSGSSFTLSNLKVPHAWRGSSGFGDADNDGDLDAFVSGVKTALDDKYIFYNNGTDSLVPDESYSINESYDSFFQFGDYDNDNDLDFVVNGLDAASGFSLVIKNLCPTPNILPSSPVNLSATQEGTNVILTWDPATDNNTPPKSLTYNIYMGTISGGIDIVSPNASLSTGFRRISRQGYIRDTAWIIKNLPIGTYYWGVQTIDNSLGASLFSAEAIFEIKDQFTETPYSESPSVSTPALYFDCDHDNDLDLFFNSTDAFQAVENKLTSFKQADYKQILSNGYNPIYSITPTDYNNDNLMDFTISGVYFTDCVLDSTLALFRYKGPFSYDIIDSTLVRNATFEYALWADLNNDGRQDLITSGKTTNLETDNKPVTYIYENKGNGVFQKTSHSVRGFEKCGAVAGDFDNDLDIDFIIYGLDSLGAANTYTYVNEGNFVFTEELIPDNELFRQFPEYGILTGDYNLDGQLDVYLAGVTLQNDKYARVLLNRSMNFTDANLPIRSSTFMSNFWADYDYDGDIDIFSTSRGGPSDKVWLYLNNNGSLEEVIFDLVDIQSLFLPFMAVNLDNKNGLDFLMKKYAGDYIQYYDNWSTNQRISTAPANTRFDQDKLDIILKWDKLANCPACTYNIRVGTTQEGVEIMSPMSDLTTGYRYVVQPGNAYLNDSWKLSDLSVGTYYWSVQAVDPSNTGGPWSPEATFTVSHIDADFSFTTVCKGDSTVFNDLSVATDPVTKWKWSFGDGTTSTLQNPKHLYSGSGTFSAGLWAYTEAGDSAYQSYPVTVKAVPVANFSADIACQGTPTTFTNNTNTNGLTISKWLWNFGDGQSSEIQNPGTHGYLNPLDYQADLTVTADNGCADSITKTVTVSGYPVTLVSASTPLTFCKGDSVILSVPYDNNYTYNWMAGGISITGSDSSQYVAKLSEDYTVEVVNSIGNCRDTSYIVAVTAHDSPVAPAISANGALEFCQGDSVILSVANTTGYSYQWKLNGGAVGISSSQYTAKASGTYSLIVSNTAGCAVEATDTVIVKVNAKPALPTVNISGPTTFCQGSGVELSVTNNSAFTYKWENNGSAITGATTNTYTAQSSGVYSLKISNSSGCYIKTENVTVNVLTAPSAPLISAGGALEFCQGDSVILSVANTSGYSYQWKLNGGAVGINSFQYIAKSAGIYSLTVSNTAGCTIDAINTVIVTVNEKPALPTLNISGPTTFCQGSGVELSVTYNSAFTYKWENNGSAITGATTNTYTAQSSGVYSLKISNSSGCYIKTESVTVNVLTVPTAPLISADGALEFCQSDSVLFNVSNTTGYSYQWKLNGGAVGNNSNQYIAKTSGTYSLTVSNSSGCIANSTNTMTVVINPKPTVPIVNVSGATSFCQGSSVNLNVASNSAYTYQWQNTGNNISGATTNSYTALTSGTYSLNISNSYGCISKTENVTITVSPSPEAPSISASGSTTFCQGDSVVLSVANTAGYTYQWRLNGGAVGLNQNSFTAKSSGDYTLTVTNSSGCITNSTNTATVTVNPKPTVPTVSISGLTSFCQGENVILSVPDNSAYSYQWQKDGSNITDATSNIYTAQNSGVYTLNILNSDGCSSRTENVTVNVLTAPSAPLISAAGELEFCQGDSVVLSVTNTAGYTYLWKLNDGAVGANQNSYVVKSSGTYSLRISNSSGCTANSTNTVSVIINTKPTIPAVSVNGAKSFCQGGSVDLSVTNNPAYTYQWQNEGSDISDATLNSYTAQKSGVYSLNILNSDGCSGKTENVTVNVLTAPVAPSISNTGQTQFCQGDSVVLSVTNTAGYTYQWKLNGGAVGSNSNQFVAKNSGNYNLVVSNANNCSVTSTNSIDITVNPVPSVSNISLSGPSTFCQGGSVTLSVPSTSGYSYNWKNEYGVIPGASTSSYTASASGTYLLEISNSSNCAVKTSPVNVVVKTTPSKPDIKSVNYEEGKCPGENIIRLYASQAVPDYQYQWYKDGMPLLNSTMSSLDLTDQGNYKLEASLGECISESEIFPISFPGAPEKPSIYARGPTVWYLVCSDTTASKYKWYCNDKLIEGANKYYYVANRKMGDYQVSIGNDKGCYTKSDIINIPNGTTGIDDIGPFKGVKIYPNPTTGLITIEMDNEVFGDLYISIVTQSGKEIHNIKLEKTTDNFSGHIDLSGESKGIYYINFRFEKYFATRKLVVE